jgi:hypothetical protein
MLTQYLQQAAARGLEQSRSTRQVGVVQGAHVCGVWACAGVVQGANMHLLWCDLP